MIIILDKETGLPIDPQRDPIDGDWVEETNGTSVKRYEWHPEQVAPAPLDVFTTANEAVTVNGFATQPFNTFYIGAEGDTINMSFDIVDDQGALQTQLDAAALGYPPLLLPVTRYAGSKATDDEIYLGATLVAGVITVSGKFKNSGNWKLTAARINASLAVIGADWGIEKPTVTFGITA
ncbi:MAG: hypothetical protein JKY89_10915 [Immundisolibacteraceae bacterium]|nr:hypothetical protein [Immundisolibacteraceae bacterium]